MGLATVFAIVQIVFSVLVFLCSGFYWYYLGAYSAADAVAVSTTITTVDAVHGAVFVVFGLMGVLAGFKLGFPPNTIITAVFLFVLAIGLSVEIALCFTVFSCSSGRFVSSAQVFLCTSGTTYSVAMTALILPLICAWVAALACLVALILWHNEDGFFFDD